jgi:hypothetical protein
VAFDWLRKTTSPTAGLGRGNNGALVVDTDAQGLAAREDDLNGKLVVQRRHIDWLENQIRWRWLLDSYEGGNRYRNAVYGPDRRGLPARNLFRHKREYPDPQQFPAYYQGFAGFLGTANTQTQDVGYGPYPGMLGADPAATSQDDDYELRRARTPVPEFVAEAVEIHLGKIYDQEVKREGPQDLQDWWADVDGSGTPIDDWMRDTCAPLLEVLGQLDLVFDHPQLRPGQKAPKTRLEEQQLGLDRCAVSYIMPENMCWYRLDAAGRYEECLVREYVDPAKRVDYDKNGNAIDPEDPGALGNAWRMNYVNWRLWRKDQWYLWNFDGSVLLEQQEHPFGRVPIVRLIDQPKHRSPHVGKSRYEGIAEFQREFYNRDSELILSDTLQSHPLLSGPEDFCKADNTLSIGPGYILPKKKVAETGAYEGWEYVSPPQDPAESLRKNKADLIELKDRRACLTKPAGAVGTSAGASVVSQSGVSKQLDAQTGHKLLVSIARSLAKNERYIAEYALLVLRNQPIESAEDEGIKISYPAKFELFSANDIVTSLAGLQGSMELGGNAPTVEGELIDAVVRQLLPGLSDEQYTEMDAEIEELLNRKALEKGAQHEASIATAATISRAEAFEGAGTDEAKAGEDPSGQSGGTLVGNVIPAVM